MAWFGSRKVETKNGTIQIGKNGLLSFMPSSKYFTDCSTLEGQLKAYSKCDVVTSLISRCAESIANLRVTAIDPKTRQVVETQESRAILEKMMHPNPYQDFKMFHRQLETDIKLHGKAYVRIVHSVLQEDFFYIIPYERIEPIYKNEVDVLFNRKVEKYIIFDGVTSYELQPNEVHIFYDGIKNDNGYEVLGGSRLASLSEVISSYIILWEMRTELYGNGGAKNIISFGAKDAEMLSAPFLEDEVSQAQTKFKKYGLMRGLWQNIFTKADAKVIKLTSPLKDFDFSNTIVDIKKAICNEFSCPPELLGIESSRFKTIPEARKEFYTQAGIPSAEYIISNWLQMLGKTKLPFILLPDYSHMDFYQEAKKEEAIAFQQMSNAVVPLVEKGIIDKNEARTKLNIT